ncbi:hypothetical protein CO613_01030 [Lysobacteraceae bacterium NML07-0707]|nr:hypothetical protein CO613_01030 [Xanthomonadaceae bacterium NML07-0707]
MNVNTEARHNGKGKLRLVTGGASAAQDAGQAKADTLQTVIGQGDALLRLPEVQSLAGLSRSGIYRLVRLGRFPKPVKVGSKASAWPLSEVQAWITARIAARDTKEVQA